MKREATPVDFRRIGRTISVQTTRGFHAHRGGPRRHPRGRSGCSHLRFGPPVTPASVGTEPCSGSARILNRASRDPSEIPAPRRSWCRWTRWAGYRNFDAPRATLTPPAARSRARSYRPRQEHRGHTPRSRGAAPLGFGGGSARPCGSARRGGGGEGVARDAPPTPGAQISRGRNRSRSPSRTPSPRLWLWTLIDRGFFWVLCK